MNAVEKAYQAIKATVLAGQLGTGQRLKESELAEEIGVSRTPIREALRRLSAEGLIDFRSGHRASVVSWTAQEAHEMFELRARLEGFGARLAAIRITDEQVDELRVLQDKMDQQARSDKEGAVAAISELNGQFHKVILDASCNRRLTKLFAGLIDVPMVLGTYRKYTREDLHRSFGHHREIISALSCRDPEWAEHAMQVHIYAARSSLLRDEKIEDDGSPMGGETTGKKRRRSGK